MSSTTIRCLSLAQGRRTSAAVTELFDNHQRALRRDRAARTRGDRFLQQRAFDDCVERLELLQRQFETALLIGCADPSWPARLERIAATVEVRDPGPLFALTAGGEAIVEDRWEPAPGAYDLVVAVGTLDTVNDLPVALVRIRHSLRPQGTFLGAMAGGDTLPQLRTAMRSADLLTGGAAPHVHPRIDPASLTGLLSAAGFVDVVVDVDRIQASYPSLTRLVEDLRATGSTNVLSSRPRPLGKAAAAAAAATFAAAGDGSRTLETFEILHLACWAPANG
jgi:NADH dehydrogenase [ubiquinone] 1 alpha subcomplex assembly factor 5